jgi:nuclear RNA export factor
MAPMESKRGPASSGRGARNAQANTGKPSTRGGISKRRGGGPLKVDRDGDLSMDASATANGSQSHLRRPKNNAAPSGPRNPRPTAKAQQIIQRVLNGDASQVSSRTRGSLRASMVPLMTLKVEGLKASKAASNEGGGLKDLLAFLERKAQSIEQHARPIRIKKVCYSLPPRAWEVTKRRTFSEIVIMPYSSQKRGDERSQPSSVSIPGS